ncbi:MAG: hypothetical protein Q8L88_08160 [Bacteroidota bacterium]|nr:hypothetical protein [Bacteroidota bacterium]
MKTSTSFLKIITLFLATALGTMSLLSGIRTLLGFSIPDKIIFIPLLISQTIMGVINIIVAVLIFRENRYNLPIAIGVFSINLVILLLITIHMFTGGTLIDPSSQNAMMMRSVVWGIIVGLLIMRKKIMDSRKSINA